MYFCHERRSERNTCHVAINYWYVMIYYVDSIAVYYYICTLLRMYAYTYTRVPRSDMPTTQRTNEISLSHSRSPINHSSFGDLLLLSPGCPHTAAWNPEYEGKSYEGKCYLRTSFGAVRLANNNKIILVHCIPVIKCLRAFDLLVCADKKVFPHMTTARYDRQLRIWGQHG